MTTLQFLTAVARARFALLRSQKDENGYTVETVIIAAGLAVIALAVIVILTTKITNKANAINLG